MVTQSIQIFRNVSKAVLELSLPDEDAVIIRTSETTLALQRHTPIKLAGLRIEIDDGEFIFPANFNMLYSKVTNDTFFDTQVKRHDFNTFRKIWATTTTTSGAPAPI